MPRACTICTHPEREAVELALAGGVSFRNVAKQFGVGSTALHRHQHHARRKPKASALEGKVAASGRQQPRPPGRREVAFPLSRQDRQMLDMLAIGEAQTIAQAAAMVGMSKGSGYSVVDSPAGRRILQAAFRAQGLTEAQLAGKVIRLLDAQTTKFFQKDGIVTGQRDVADNQTQLGAARLAAELMDLKPQEGPPPPPAPPRLKVTEQEVTLPDGTKGMQRIVEFGIGVDQESAPPGGSPREQVDLGGT